MARRFELQGHRGARGLFPENTLEGFRATIALGVDAIELDIGVTADGVPVVFHDATLNGDIVRGPDGTWLAGEGPAIHALSFAELMQYDVGRLRPDTGYAAAQVAQDGARIPTLAATFGATGGVRIDAELKTIADRPELTVPPAEMAERVLAVAEAAGALGRLDLRSFDWRGLRHARALRPGLKLTFLTNARTVAAAALWWGGPSPADYGGSVPRAVAAEAGAACWAPSHVGLQRAEIEEAHALGLRVVPWTVNDPADMERLIAWEVDGICTDRPDLARTVMARAGLPLPGA
ncbi:Glycerophosphoryl diester phosphodiesterase [Rhodovastum atsumiense]|uniref:Glycerophosphodiester phosphodiesterase n=1 Tax=Rhodovastum atsumiense TaxID=504468 RepID=A0A5M6ITA0_9PROT|nr:glycerophosphodiester phosphodiesterase family protein [Rhodovastum atsumiense]KAA5611139.1 glycerophosphodiester phosphodiesterase [Rhodovastum atsumiense]CAH2599212.1 Glycerophosphoryl diester phosphodiesterase [Rhodovastum atsumiense]